MDVVIGNQWSKKQNSPAVIVWLFDMFVSGTCGEPFPYRVYMDNFIRYNDSFIDYYA